MLKVPEVIVPPHPGITSALGLLIADQKYDVIHTQFQVSTSVDLARFNAEFAEMEAKLTARLTEDGLGADDVRFERAGDLRYLGQGYELRVPIDPGEVTETALSTVWQRFHDSHAAEYGHAFEDSPIEIVNLRMTAVGASPALTLPTHKGAATLDAAMFARGTLYFGSTGRLQSFETQVYRRDLLPLGQTITGPAILLQKDSTTVVPPGATATPHETGSLIITLEGTL